MDDPLAGPGNGRNSMGGLIPALIAFVAFLVLIASGYRDSFILFALSLFSVILIIVTVEKKSPAIQPRPQAVPVDEETQTPLPVNFSGILSLAFLLVLAGIIAGGIIPAMTGRGHRHPRQLTACKSNLKNLATALEMYSTDNSGRYPQSLGLLTPSYIRIIPTCPAAGVSTYAYYFGINPDAYTMCCSGRWHRSVISNPDFPQYDSFQGLIDHP